MKKNNNCKKIRPYIIGNWLCFGYGWKTDDAIEYFRKIYKREPNYTILNKRYGFVIGDVDA